MPIFIDKKKTGKKILLKKKAAKVMHEFKKGKLPAGKSDTIVTYLKQAIAVALSEAKNLEN